MAEHHPRPQHVWNDMVAGNARFIAGEPEHPNQDVARRASTEAGQAPRAALFGCSDSRLAAEIIFDNGLGDLFVVRNAGHIISDSVIASLEYATAMLGVSLIVVLAHDSCGAIHAAIESRAPHPAPLPVRIETMLDPIIPSVQSVWLAEHSNTPYVDPKQISAEKVNRHHLRTTVSSLLYSSEVLSDAVASGDVGIIGAHYRLSEGRVEPIIAVGEFDAALIESIP
jgi:carbonic anhydrase